MTAPPPRVASALSNTHIAARKAEREALARDLAAKLPSHRPVTKATSSGVGQQQGPPLPHRASVTTLSSGPSSFRGDTRRPSLATNGASSNPSSFLLPPQVAATAHNEGLTTTTLSVSSRPASVSGTSSQQGGGASYAAKAHEKAMAAKVLSSSFASAGRGGRGSEAGSEFGDQQQPNDAVGTFGALYSSMRSVTSSVGGGGIAPSSPLKRRQSTRRQSAAWMDDEDSVLFDDEPIQAEVVIQLKNGAPRKGEGTSRISKSVSHGASMMRRASSTRGILPSPSSSPSRQHQRTSSNNSNNNNNNSLQLDPQEEVSILKARVRYLEAKQQRKDTTQLEGIVGRGGSDFCPPGLLVDPRTGRRFCRLASFPLHTDAPPPWSLPWNSHLLENSLNPLTSASAASAPPLLSFEHLSDAAAEVGVQQQQSSVPRRGTHLVQSSTPHSPDVYEPPTPSGALAATAKRTQSGVLINQAESTDVAEGAESPLSNSTARSLSLLLRSPDGGVSTAAAGPPAYVLPPAILLTNHNNSSKSSSARRGGSPNQVPRSTSPDAHDSAVVRNIHSSSLKPSLQKSDDGENSFMELRGEESASSPAWSDHHNYFHPTDKQQPLTSLPHVAHSSPPKRSGRSVDDPTFGPRKRSVFFANGEGVDLVSPAAHPASPSLAAPSPSYYATTGGPLIRFEALSSPDASEGAAGGDGAAAETSLFTPSFGPATHTAGSSSTNSTTNTGGGATTSSSPPLISRGAEEQKDTAGVVHRRGAALHGAPSPQEGTTFRGRRLNSFWEPSGDMDGDEGSPRSGSPGYFTLPSAANAPVVVPTPAAATAPAPIALSETVSFYSMNVRRKAPQAAASTSIQQQQPQLQQQQKVLQLEPHVMTVTAPTPPSRSPPPSTATTLQPPSSPPPSSNARAVNGPQQSTTTTGRQSEASRIEALFPAAPETAAPSSTTASNTTTTARTSGASSTPSAPSVQLLQRALQQAQREAEGKESNNSNNNCTPVEMEQVCRFVVPAEMQSGFELMDRTRRAQLLEKRIKAVLSRRSK